MKYTILLAVLLSPLFSSIVSAQPPDVCPDVPVIQSVGLSKNLVQDAAGKWYAGRTAQLYDTPQKWTFVIGGISARNSAEALAMANAALNTLVYISGPNPTSADKYICLYRNRYNFPSGAITPPIDISPAINIS